MIGIIRRDGSGKVVSRDVYNALPPGVDGGDEQFDLTQPSELAAFTELQTDTQYRQDRIVKYSPTGDQLDLLIKSLKYMKEDGVDIGPDGESLISMSDAVKSDYPKPE